MTVVNVIWHPNAVHVLTDGAMRNHALGLTMSVSKVFPVPHLNAVIAFRGPALLAALASPYLQANAASYDHLKSTAAGELKKLFDEQREHWRQLFVDPQIECVVAGISETTGSDSYFICSHNLYGRTPWKLEQLSDCSMMPGDPAILKEFQRRYPNVHSGAELDPVKDGIVQMEIQRQFAAPDDVSQALDHMPGRFVQLTTVSVHGITTQVIHRWPEDA